MVGMVLSMEDLVVHVFDIDLMHENVEKNSLVVAIYFKIVFLHDIISILILLDISHVFACMCYCDGD